MGSITIPITILNSEKNENKANTTTITSFSIGPTITQRSEIITSESTPDMTETTEGKTNCCGPNHEKQYLSTIYR